MIATSSMPASDANGLLSDMNTYLEASFARYKACISEVKHQVSLSDPKATVHLQYVKFDPNTGEPKFDLLAKALAKHVVSYSLSAQTRAQIKKMPDYAEDEGELFIKARDYFRKIHDSGEVGELLLFFLLEAAFGAPQVVCKMELKTNPNDEVKGTDGIHVRWDDADDHLDVFLGESKLHKQISGALTSVFKSLIEFYDQKRLTQELLLVTSHFKHLDNNLKDAVTRFLNYETTEKECHIIHACLIGWSWEQYKLLATEKRDVFFKEFETLYKQYSSSIERMLNERLSNCKYKHITYKFLFLPFRCVEEFRRAFYKELCGVNIGTAND